MISKIMKSGLMDSIMGLAAIVLLTGVSIYSSNNLRSNQTKEYTPQQIIELQQKQKEFEKNVKTTEADRTQRKLGIYNEPCAFTNADGSIDKYFPVEGDIWSSQYNMKFYSRNKSTGELEIKSTDNPWKINMFNIDVLYDLKTNQVSFVEFINPHHPNPLSEKIMYDISFHLSREQGAWYPSLRKSPGRGVYSVPIRTGPKE